MVADLEGQKEVVLLEVTCYPTHMDCTHDDLLESSDGESIKCQNCGRGSVELVVDLEAQLRQANKWLDEAENRLAEIAARCRNTPGLCFCGSHISTGTRIASEEPERDADAKRDEVVHQFFDLAREHGHQGEEEYTDLWCWLRRRLEASEETAHLKEVIANAHGILMTSTLGHQDENRVRSAIAALGIEVTRQAADRGEEWAQPQSSDAEPNLK